MVKNSFEFFLLADLLKGHHNLCRLDGLGAGTGAKIGINRYPQNAIAATYPTAISCSVWLGPSWCNGIRGFEWDHSGFVSGVNTPKRSTRTGKPIRVYEMQSKNTSCLL